MKKFLKTLFLLIVVGLIVAAVASMQAKKRLDALSDDEIRAYLATKLDGKVGEEQLATIQDATIAGIRKVRKGVAAEPETEPEPGPDSGSQDADTEVASETADDAG